MVAVAKFDDKGEILANFLGSYFYQQSEFDFDDDITPVLEVKQSEDLHYVELLRERMTGLSQLDLKEHELRSTLLNLGAEHVPVLDGSARGWLEAAIQKLT